MTYRIVAVIGLLALAGILAAKSGHNEHAKHHANTPTLTQSGQSAFAAISEVIAQLEADPETDWGKVNINALRQHLQDMHFLMLYASANQQKTESGWQFTVTGEGQTLYAIKRMVPMHAGELDKMDKLSAAARTQGNGVQLTISSEDQAMRDKVSGLGFFGLMALGSHHQIHHYHIALV